MPLLYRSRVDAVVPSSMVWMVKSISGTGFLFWRMRNAALAWASRAATLAAPGADMIDGLKGKRECCGGCARA